MGPVPSPSLFQGKVPAWSVPPYLPVLRLLDYKGSSYRFNLTHTSPLPKAYFPMVLSVPRVQVKRNAALPQGMASQHMASPGPQKPLSKEFSPLHVSSATLFLWCFSL